MKRTTYFIMPFFVIGACIACSPEVSTLQPQKVLTNNVTHHRTNVSEILTPQSELFTVVNKEAQQNMLKRMDIDYHPTREDSLYLDVYMLKSTPQTDYSSIKFVPVITGPHNAAERKRIPLLSPCHDVSWMYGKTTKGENIYFKAEYTDWSKWEPDKNSEYYKHRVQETGQAATDALYRRKQNRTGPFRWQITYYPKGSFMYKLIEYARQHSDDGSFFVITSGPFHYCKICYFKNGKVYRSFQYSDQEGIEPEELYL